MCVVALSVVIPAYNECERIGGTLEAVFQHCLLREDTFEIIVVDDGSTDGTLEIVESFAREHAQVAIVSYAPNRGKGYAVRAGVMCSRGSLVLFSDADLATPIEEITLLQEEIDSGCDIAIASRALHDSVLIVRQPLYRQLGGRMVNTLIRAMAVPNIKDTQCGFKLFRQTDAKNIFSRCKFDDFSFDVEVLYLASKFGLVVREVPVRWIHVDGSKVSPFRDGLRLLGALFRIKRLHKL